MTDFIGRWWKTAAFVFGVLLLFYLANRTSFTSPPPQATPASSGLGFTYWALIILALGLWVLPSLTNKVPGSIKWLGILLLLFLLLFGARAFEVARTAQTMATGLVLGGNEGITSPTSTVVVNLRPGQVVQKAIGHDQTITLPTPVGMETFWCERQPYIGLPERDNNGRRYTYVIDRPTPQEARFIAGFRDDVRRKLRDLGVPMTMDFVQVRAGQRNPLNC